MEYLENYLVLIVGITIMIEVCKMYFPKSIHPKWPALGIAVLLSVLFSFTEYFDGHYIKLLVSFGLSVLFYDYVFKVVKDLILKKVDSMTEKK